MPAADFSLWDRKNLEQFARQASDENKQLREACDQLRADLRFAIDEMRAASRSARGLPPSGCGMP